MAGDGSHCGVGPAELVLERTPQIGRADRIANFFNLASRRVRFTIAINFWRAALGYERPIRGGQSVTALPRCSDVNLLCDCERVIDLDAKVSDRALHLGVPKEQLNRAEVPGPPVNQSRLGSPQRMGAE